MIDAAGLPALFLCAGPFTTLAPNNAAFDKVDPAILATLTDPANVETLQAVLLYHLLPGAYFSAVLMEGPLTTLQGEDVVVSLDPIMFNDGEVVVPDVAACNGVIHLIDEMLSPPSLGKFCHRTRMCS